MKGLLLSALPFVAWLGLVAGAQQQGVSSDDVGTTPAVEALYSAAEAPGGLRVGGAVLQATNGPGYNSTISVTYDHEIEPGVIVPITVEYEPPPNQARSTSMRLFRLDLEATMREFPPHKKQA